MFLNTDKNLSIYLAGHRGMLGRAVLKRLKEQGFKNIITRTSGELDLTDGRAVNAFFKKERPACVILAAALVGGIAANISRPADFIHVNLTVQNNVIHAAHLFGARKLLFFGSSCMYPGGMEQPIPEKCFLEGPPEKTSLPYAVAKIAGAVQCAAYRTQYGLNAVVAVPAGLYGPGDNFDPENSHVLAGILRKIHEAQILGRKKVVIWGDGTPRREFLYVDDAAEAVLYLLEHYDSGEIINLGSGVEVSVSELTKIICETVGFKGQIVFDPFKPGGAFRKILNSSKITRLGWKPRVSLREGIKRTYRWFLENNVSEMKF